MTKYYNPQRKRNIYDPASEEPFKLSRSKLDLFVRCPRCFYLDRKLGVAQPPGFPFTLNSAVDALLKKEFDLYRTEGKPHPLMLKNNVDAIPFAHEKLEDWRNSLRKGIQFHDIESNFIITGGVDDIWITPEQELIIVDYKATSKNEPVTLDADWQIGYKRQMSLYAWLFKKNGFKVHDTGYFVYCNGLTTQSQFDQKLEFDIVLLPYKIDDSWVEETIKQAHDCLNQNIIPNNTADCDYCRYIFALQAVDQMCIKSSQDHSSG